MSRLSEFPLAITIPDHHQRLLRELREDTYNIRSLDPVTRELVELPWPVIGEARVVPSALRKHRESHQFLGPCCLCPLFAQDGRSAFVEAAIFIAISGPDAGYYVAKCARGECGYLVCIERIYARCYGVHLRAYPPRDDNEARPPPVYHYSEIESEILRRSSELKYGGQRELKRTYAIADLSQAPTAVHPRRLKRTYAVADLSPAAPQCPPSKTLSQNAQRLFQRLSSIIQPGLTETEFRNLFTKCGVCGLIKIGEVNVLHLCPQEVTDSDDTD